MDIGPMDDEPRRVTLSKAHRSTPAGRELIALLTELSADGQVTREEMDRLRIWLEVDRGVDFPACAFLYGIVEPISRDVAITEEALDTLAIAIERVLPSDVRLMATLRRKEHRAARRTANAAKRAAERAHERTTRIEARELARPLHRADFVVMGTRRSAERREGCAGLEVGEAVTLEREPDNIHDGNAILVVTQGGTELGYVPREDAKQMAPFLDAGAEVDATVKKLLNRAEGDTLPVVISTLRRGGGDPRPSLRTPVSQPLPDRPPASLAHPPATSFQYPPAGASPPAVRSRPPGWVWVVYLVVLALALVAYCSP
jgi:hypothetical protein